MEQFTVSSSSSCIDDGEQGSTSLDRCRPKGSAFGESIVEQVTVSSCSSSSSNTVEVEADDRREGVLSISFGGCDTTLELLFPIVESWSTLYWIVQRTKTALQCYLNDQNSECSASGCATESTLSAEEGSLLVFTEGLQSGGLGLGWRRDIEPILVTCFSELLPPWTTERFLQSQLVVIFIQTLVTERLAKFSNFELLQT